MALLTSSARSSPTPVFSQAAGVAQRLISLHLGGNDVPSDDPTLQVQGERPVLFVAEQGHGVPRVNPFITHSGRYSCLFLHQPFKADSEGSTAFPELGDSAL